MAMVGIEGCGCGSVLGKVGGNTSGAGRKGPDDEEAACGGDDCGGWAPGGTKGGTLGAAAAMGDGPGISAAGSVVMGAT